MTDEEIEIDTLNKEHDRLYKYRDLEIFMAAINILIIFISLMLYGYQYIKWHFHFTY